MVFYQEPPHYEKTILSDLQGSWTLLREAMDLTRFSGHFIFTMRGVRDGKEAEAVRAGVPATDG
jgi:hypothetical protein